MRRTVFCSPQAEDELAEIWLASSDRNQVTLAGHYIDSKLKLNAESVGVHLSEGIIALDVSPLRVLFEIVDEDRMVRVLNVKPIV